MPNLFTRFLVCSAAALAVAAIGAGPARAQQPLEKNVCVGKSERTGGRMRFIVREEDAERFEKAGFSRIGCPEAPDEAIAAQEARCQRLRALEPIGKEIVRDLYGLSVEEMCGATDLWVAARRQEAANE